MEKERKTKADLSIIGKRYNDIVVLDFLGSVDGKGMFKYVCLKCFGVYEAYGTSIKQGYVKNCFNCRNRKLSMEDCLHVYREYTLNKVPFKTIAENMKEDRRLIVRAYGEGFRILKNLQDEQIEKVLNVLLTFDHITEEIADNIKNTFLNKGTKDGK